MEIVRFQGEQNKQLQKNSNGFHVNSFPQSHDAAEISAGLLMKDFGARSQMT